jgi:GTPase SAR1 family protein
LKLDDTDHQPLTYTLTPIQSIYYQPHYVYRPLDSTNSIRLEQNLVELSTSIKLIEMYFNENMQNLLCGHFKKRLFHASIQWSTINEEYLHIIDHYAKLIVDIRCGQIRTSAIDKKFRINKKQIDIKNRIDYLTEEVIDLNAKGHLISDLYYQQIEYCDVTEHNITRCDNEIALKGKLVVDENNDRVLCSSDELNKTNPTLVKELRQNLLDELMNNPKLHLIYADFSYCDYPLQRMMILPRNKKEDFSTKKIRTSTNPSSTIETINILLLGETGVGKSTFINALINYLTFQTLDNAQSNEPMVVIPASFVMTVGNNLDEYTVKSDDSPHSKNEDFDHPGQSVTQHCQSYIYNLNENLKLRIIDTPGFGDTRGLDQDNRNMQHILECIKKFQHLNAICFLLKSNESQLNIFLRMCFTQLFNLFGPDIRDNIIFCFTNSRSTFYTPGNTALLLKDMLSSLVIPEIPFNKKNTFCFDNESFRYLIARQNHVPFSNLDKQEYEISWKNSVAELHRLIHYIRKNLLAYPVPDESKVIKYTTIKIAQLTHPMLETMRYILRNIIINKMNSLKQSVELHTNNDDVDHNYPRLPHQPILLDFLEDYQIFNDPLSQKQHKMIDHLSLFCQISAEFSYFLSHIAHYRNGDPFLIGLFRLIGEEKEICEEKNRNYMNLQLIDSLQKLMNNYEQRLQSIQSTSTNIYHWIKYLNKYPLTYGYVIDTSQINIQDGILKYPRCKLSFISE